MTTVVIGGREFVLGALYAPAEPLAGKGQRRAPRWLKAYIPPERCEGWYAERGGRVRTAYLSGAPGPSSSADHWAEWAGERIEQ